MTRAAARSTVPRAAGVDRPGHGSAVERAARAAAIALPVALATLAVAACATRPFDLQGHRGARGLAPENTLPAFATALSIGVATLELDVAVTNDDVIVISHDPFVNPDLARLDGQWIASKGPAIHSLSLAELERYDVGRVDPRSRYARTLPDQKPVDGTHIPRLAEVFALTRRAGNRDIRFNIETKVSPLAPAETLPPEPFVERLIAMIYANGMQQQVTIQSFDWRTLVHAQRIAPEIPTVYLSAQQKFFDNIGVGSPDGSPWTAGIQARDHGNSVPRMVRAAGGRAWSPFFRDVDEARVGAAHALGLDVVVWTVNQPEDIDRMLDLRVDGIISDRPDLVRAAMMKRNMSLPDATPVLP